MRTSRTRPPRLVVAAATAAATFAAIAALAGCKARSGAKLASADEEPAIELSDDAVRTRMREGLAYLYETQIPEYQYSKPKPFAEPNFAAKQDGFRMKGEWPSYVRGSIMPDQKMSAIYDSNVFVTLFVLYPLFLLDESGLPEGARRIAGMKRDALKMIAPDDQKLDYRYLNRGGEVNFWPIYEDFHGPSQIAERMPFARLLGPVFDIQNDADDTSVFYMTAIKYLAETPNGLKLPEAPKTAIPRILEPCGDRKAGNCNSWVDSGRVRKDSREAGWKPDGTGAIMTWFSDEDKPFNVQPISFALANNVDCVVIANAMYALGLNKKLNGGKRDISAYDDSCKLERKVLLDESYPLCALYYPAKWLFPYAYSRALRDGGNECLGEPLQAGGPDPVKALVARILKPGTPESGDRDPSDGSWGEPAGSQADVPEDRDTVNPEFAGDARAYSTALNIITLHNLGATKWGDPAVDAAVKQGVTYLINHGHKNPAAPAKGKDAGRFWQGGVFFSSSVQQIARWKSRPYATAVVFEALLKYRLDYGDKAKTDAKLKLACDDVPGWCK